MSVTRGVQQEIKRSGNSRVFVYVDNTSVAYALLLSMHINGQIDAWGFYHAVDELNHLIKTAPRKEKTIDLPNNNKFIKIKAS